MANPIRPPTKEVGPTDFVSITSVSDPATFPTPDFTVSGAASPASGTVLGILTNKVTLVTIPSTPAAVPYTGGAWIVQFRGIPPGSYILAVNEQLPDEGAKAINAQVTSAVSLDLTLSSANTQATATVTNHSPGELVVSAVLSMSPHNHGDPRHKTIPAGGSQDFVFRGLPRHTAYTVNVYPVTGHANGAVGNDSTT